MVHGISCNLQYEVYLKNKIDLYDDVLPICIDIREMISIEKIKNKDQYKLVIIDGNKLENYIRKNKEIYDIVQKYHSALYINYNYEKNKLYQNYDNYDDEEFLFYNVIIYENKIKNNILPNVLTKEEFEIIKNKYKQIENNEEKVQEMGKLCKIIEIQQIITNPEFFNKIIDIEKKITNIQLNDDLIELINKVLLHPKLQNLIEWHGINIIDYYF